MTSSQVTLPGTKIIPDTEGTTLGAKFKAVLVKKVPIVGWLPKYDRMTAVSDLIAGITLGLTLVPQSIAYASLAGLKVQYGLYSAFVGTMLYVLFGTIKEVSIGPTSLMALLTFQTCRGLPVEYVVLLTFLSGCIVMAMGLLRLGFLVDLISAPVTSGFSSATALIIVFSQLKSLLGLKFQAETVLENVELLAKHIHETRPMDVLLGFVCCTVLLSLRKLTAIPAKQPELKKILWIISISRNAITVFATALLAFLLHRKDPDNLPITLSGQVKGGLPSISLPPFSVTVGNETVGFLDMVGTLGSSIVLVPIVMVLANIAIAKAFSTGGQIDATQEMLTLGMCNLVGSLVRSMPTCGAFTRSAVSNSSGVRTPLAGLYSGIITLLALAFMTEYFYFIPKATLGSVLICAVIFMVDVKIFKTLWYKSKADFFMLVLTFSIAMLKTVEWALFFGMLMNISMLVYSWARPSILAHRVKSIGGGEYVRVVPGLGLFYLNAEYFATRLEEAARAQGVGLLPVLVDCSTLHALDYSAAQCLEKLNKKYKDSSQKLIFYNASIEVLSKLESFTTINARHLRAQNEEELLDDMFGQKEDVIKLDTAPLLSDSFKEKDSAGECSLTHEMKDLNGP